MGFGGDATRDISKAMWKAAADGKLSEVTDLKAKGASPNWFNPWEPPGRGYQFTSLHMAAGNGHTEVVKHLVEKCGADITAKVSYGETALEYAISRGTSGREAVIKYLDALRLAHEEKLRAAHEAEEKRLREEKKKAAEKGQAKK